MHNHRKMLFVFVLVFYFNCPAFAYTSSEKLNPAEKYVIEQVEKGSISDFTGFPVDSRILRADFLKKLLTGAFIGLEVTERGIHIGGARIKEILNFREEKILFPTSLTQCKFEKNIEFIDTTFSGKVNFSGTKFSGDADFYEAKFSGIANFSGAEFYGIANFPWAEFYGAANFYDAKFSGVADFSGAKFSGIANFPGAKFSGDTDFTGAEFYGAANFYKAKFSGEAYFSEAKFSGAGGTSFSKVKFFGVAYFLYAEFSEWADFSKTEFSEKADFSYAKFTGQSYFIGADLRNANLRNADLSRGDLSEADLSGAELSETNLKDSLLWNARGIPFNCEPKAGSQPYIPSIANLPNLSQLTFKKSPHGLVDLREGFKKFGYREQEREITYAIKHTQRCNLWKGKESSLWDKLESIFYYPK